MTHDVGADQLILPRLMRGIGQPLFTNPLSQLSTAGLAPRDTADASALSNMTRDLSAAIGMLAAQLRREAYLMAYADGFWLVGASFVLSLAVIAILRKPPRSAGPVAVL